MDAETAKRLARDAWERSVIPGNIHVYLAWCWADGNIPSQNQLYRIIQKRILGLVTSYELALQAAKVDPNVPAKINYCLEMMRSLKMQEYNSWFRSAAAVGCFQGKAPRDWFIEAGHKDLAESLVHRNSHLRNPAGTDVPLRRPDSLEEGNIDPLPLALSLQNAIANANRPDRWLRHALASHHPRNYELSRRARRALLPSYRSLVAEAERLMTIFGEGVEKDEFSDSGDFSSAALFCLRRLYQRGPSSFGEWYFSAQPEFAALSPNAWLFHSDCHLLAVLFQMFIPGFGSDGTHWILVGDSTQVPGKWSGTSTAADDDYE